ncbi:hypothetical protein HELRODRAFT_164164 [Helobdella robusta]|uniref:Uncharacterized protein n=1 Tax=Helobdella robusta TaxID=6412 RepID=T1EV10_HELRO|nr:hypothetical protein HELRODRAFT_164164 [Helobdella robusta]ESN94338.1 hypothetical protein HELRODRAFT_164164 [Helobdella robusta]
MPNNTSIFIAELKAIDVALDNLKEKNNKYFIIMSDSLSAVMALKQIEINNDLIKSIKIKIHNLIQDKYNIQIIWIPSQIGIACRASAVGEPHGEGLNAKEKDRNSSGRDEQLLWVNSIILAQMPGGN